MDFELCEDSVGGSSRGFSFIRGFLDCILFFAGNFFGFFGVFLGGIGVKIGVVF